MDDSTPKMTDEEKAQKEDSFVKRRLSVQAVDTDRSPSRPVAVEKLQNSDNQLFISPEMDSEADISQRITKSHLLGTMRG